MQLSVYVLGREVATLEQSGDFKSVLTYHPHVAADDFVSLTMPVRLESYVWDDQLPPVLQMNLPEGYLLQVLQEQFGPHIGASPIALLSVIGRNMVGRLQVAAPGAQLNEPAQPIEVAALLKGDNSEAAFAALVRQRRLGRGAQVSGCAGRNGRCAGRPHGSPGPAQKSQRHHPPPHHQRLQRPVALCGPERTPVHAGGPPCDARRQDRGV